MSKDMREYPHLKELTPDEFRDLLWQEPTVWEREDHYENYYRFHEYLTRDFLDWKAGYSVDKLSQEAANFYHEPFYDLILGDK